MIMRALNRPPRHSQLKTWIGRQQIGSVAVIAPNFYVVYQTFARAEQKDLQLIVHRRADVFANARDTLDRRPNTFARFITVSPVMRKTPVAVRVLQFQAAPAATRPVAPLPAHAVGQFIDNVLRAIF